MLPYFVAELHEVGRSDNRRVRVPRDFPAIATGIYGLPPDYAARLAVQTIRFTLKRVGQTRLVAFGGAVHRYVQDAFDGG